MPDCLDIWHKASSLSLTIHFLLSSNGDHLAAKRDSLLSDYGVVVLDEAHAHTIATDLLLALLKTIVEKRKHDLKVVIMSATMDFDMFQRYFPGSVVETVGGKPFDMQIRYMEHMPDDLTDAIVATVLQIHHSQRSGNILVLFKNYFPGSVIETVGNAGMSK